MAWEGRSFHWLYQPFSFPATVLKAMRLTSTGGTYPAWPSNGLGLGDSLSFGSEHHAIPDGAGGFLFAWNDFRVGAVALPGGDTLRSYLLRPRAARVTGAGAFASGWLGGIQVSQDSAHVTGYDIAFVGDGAGGAMFGWEDVRSGYFGQRLDGSGAKQWKLADVRLVGEPGGQSTPAIGVDGAGGALVGWTNVRAVGTFSPGFAGAFVRRSRRGGHARDRHDAARTTARVHHVPRRTGWLGRELPPQRLLAHEL
jgi:hypothetical protein